VVAKRLKPIMVEAVVRGYIIGSGWKDYQDTGASAASAAGRPAAGGKTAAADLHPGRQGRPGRARRKHQLCGNGKRIGAELAAKMRDVAIQLYKKRPNTPPRAASSSPTPSSNSAWTKTASCT
jgi:phosphoribosylaminoimidazole-succinocarboxamide synthase